MSRSVLSSSERPLERRSAKAGPERASGSTVSLSINAWWTQSKNRLLSCYERVSVPLKSVMQGVLALVACRKTLFCLWTSFSCLRSYFTISFLGTISLAGATPGLADLMSLVLGRD